MSGETDPTLEEFVQQTWFRAEPWFQRGATTLRPVTVLHPQDDMAREDVQQAGAGRRLMGYHRSGLEALRVLENVLGAHGRTLATESCVLDFAGGYGRLLRFLALELGPERLWHSDILPDTAGFVRRTLGVNSFLSSARPEEIAFPRRFSLIFVGSLFSHLPRETYGGFLRALTRALEPGGLLVYSTHTTEVLPADRQDPSGFTFREESESHVLDKGAYGSTFVRPDVVRALAEEFGCAHVASLERELWSIQDLHVASSAPVREKQVWKPAAVARGTVIRCELQPDGHAWIGGFVRVPALHGPGASVELVVDGDRRVPAATRPLGEPLARELGGDRVLQIDWYLEGAAPELLEGRHSVAACVRWPDGEAACFDVGVLEAPRSGVPEA